METINFREYQNKTLEVYKRVKEIFDTLGIEMIANSGTLMGIIRHNNDFIPWDDDLDFLISYKKYRDNYDEIKSIFNNISDLHHFDFINNEEKLPGNLIMSRVYSTEKYNIDLGFTQKTARPFIDLFFLIPSNAFWRQKKWISYRRLHLIRWKTREGFRRYLSNVDNPSLVRKKNIKTWPLKLVYWNRVHEFRIIRPYNKNYSDEDWNTLRRADKWAHRKVIYKLDNLIIKDIRGIEVLINKDYNYELVETFGIDWENEEIELPHFLSRKHTKHLRNVEIDKFLDNEYGKS